MVVVFLKTNKISQILGIINNKSKPNLVKKFSRIKLYNALALVIVRMGAKFEPLEKDKND